MNNVKFFKKWKNKLKKIKRIKQMMPLNLNKNIENRSINLKMTCKIMELKLMVIK